MTTRERNEVAQGWLTLLAGIVQAHCILWDHSPTYRSWAERQRERVRGWLAPRPYTWLKGKLARDVAEALGDD